MRDRMTRRTAGAVLAGVASGAVQAAAEPPAEADPLAGHVWRERVLLVFVPAEGPALEAQRRHLAAARQALARRVMVALAVIGVWVMERVPGPGGSMGGEAAAAGVRGRWAVPAGGPFLPPPPPLTGTVSRFTSTRPRCQARPRNKGPPRLCLVKRHAKAPCARQSLAAVGSEAEPRNEEYESC